MVLQNPVCRMHVETEKASFKVEVWRKVYSFCIENCTHLFVEGPRIAYFLMDGLASYAVYVTLVITD